MLYVDLHRNFVNFEDLEEQDKAVEWSLRLQAMGQEEGWSDLLVHRIVVILGEAGTGKTTEFQEQARALDGGGRTAFFIPLEDLADLRLAPAVQDRMERWKGEIDEGFFFLDSVDEARLAHPSAFRRALNNFVRELGVSATRANVVLSCRVSDWQYRADLETMRAALRPITAGEEKSEDAVHAPETDQTIPETPRTVQKPSEDERPEVEVKLVKMAPLDDARIAQLASAWGVVNLDAFMSALSGGDYEIFASRPRDLEWLVRYWQEHGTFGDLAEMVELNVLQKLGEHNPAHTQQDEPLSSGRARAGIDALAAASVLCNTPMIMLPDPAIERTRPPRSLSPRDVLPDWSDREIQALLTRAIFDPATFGRVRFHEPMVRDYLAACWMAGKVAKGQRIAKVRGLLLRDSFGVPRPVPSKRSVLGWLATKIPDIRREIITVAPEILLYCGDVSRVPIDERGQALRAMAARLQKTGRTDWTVFDSDVRRIVDPGLAPVIRELLQTEAGNYEIALLLLRMVKLGHLSECADCAQTVALDENRDDAIRVEATRAVASAGCSAQKATLFQYAREAEGLSNRFLGGLCGALFTREFGVEDCLALARRGTAEEIGAGLGQSFEFEIVDECSGIQMVSLLSGLLKLAREPPFLRLNDEDLISEKFTWTLGATARLLARLLRGTCEQEYPADKLVEAYVLLDRCRNHPDLFVTGIDRLKKELAGAAAMRRPIYWGVIRERFRRTPNARWRAWRLTDEMLVLNREDLPWLLEDALSLSDAAELEVVFDTALGVWQMAGRSELDAQTIAETVERSSAGDELKRSVRQSISPAPREETPTEREYRERRDQRKQDARAAVAEACEKLRDRTDEIASGMDFGALHYLQERMRRSKTASHSTWAQTNWQDLIPDFGDNLALAARDGFKAWWKSWAPPLPFEMAGKNSVENGVVVGLTGLAIAAEDNAIFDRLSPELAETAAHYALREMNGFPGWFEDLAKSHPETIRAVLSKQIAAELTADRHAPDPGGALANIRYGPSAVRELCSDMILDRLANDDPPRLKMLNDALRSLVASGDALRDRLSEIAATRAEKHASAGNEEALLDWLIAWVCVDGSKAWNFVERLVAERKETPSPFVLSLAATFGDRLFDGHDIEDANFLRPDVLERLIRTVFEHVRLEDDPRPQGLHDVGAREKAQHFRGWMMGFLAKQPGDEAQHVLRALASDLGSAADRQWIRNLAEQQAAATVEYSPWAPSDVAEFGAVHEKAPNTPVELFEIARDRIEDIKEDIERGEFSDRDLFRPGMAERPIQRWLAGRLERESRGHYSVIREEEVDRREETDVRLHNPAAGIVTIEIKPVDSEGSRYSFNQLLSAMEDQLVGQYLRAAHARHGILVVAMLERRRWNPKDGAGWIDFPELIERLNGRAQALVETDDRVDELSVIGIDFADSHGA